MSFSLLPATPADMPILTSIYLEAFQNELARVAFPRSSPHIREWWTSMNIDDMKNQPSGRFLKIVEGDVIVAYAKWNVPIIQGGETIVGGDDPDNLPTWPQDADVQLCNEFFGRLASERQRIMGKRPHYYLEFIATLPEHQGKGAAGRMIRWGLEQADRDCLEAYVEASPVSVPVYEHYGWKVVGAFTPKNLSHVESFMLRPAKQRD
ncbi:hypothetical protein MMC19_004544 [Ptychographa xylographoides]|nr:hypothetical protein [Ptychographa xylographoides]